MNEVENGLRRIRKGEHDEAYTALLASLPALDLLKKLMERKNRSKRPFTSFSFAEAHKEIEEAYAVIEDSLTQGIRFEECVKVLKNVSDIAYKASQEIKMPSLKSDYLWAKDTFDLSLSAFPH